MPENILVIRFSSLGDIILTSATIINLRIHFPDARISYLTKERFRPVVELFDGVDEVLAIPDESGPAAFTRAMWRLAGRRFTHVIDLHAGLRSRWASVLLTADHHLTYDTWRAVRQNIVRTKYYPRHPRHVIDRYNRAVRPLGVLPYCDRPVLKIPGDDGEPVVDSNRPLVAIAPGAAHPTKAWPLERFAKAAELIRRATDAHVFWLLTATDADRLAAVVPEDPDMFKLVDYPVRSLARLISRCRVTVANDSGIAHLSSAVGTPALVLFGPTHPSLGFSPRGLFDRVIEVSEFCRPCSLHGRKPCYREEQFCFTRIHPEQVAEQAVAIIESDIRRQRGLIVDRDGTLMVNRHYLADPEGVELETGAAEAVRRAQRSGYRVVVVSNQSGVARGMFDREAVERVNRRLLELLAAEDAEPDALYYCPHHPTEGESPEYTRWCRCRKPGGGMVEAAAEALGIDLRRSVVVGDSADDVNLARVVGARAILVRTGWGRDTERRLAGSTGGGVVPFAVCDSLLDAVQLLEREHV